MNEKPFIIERLLDQHTLTHYECKRYLDAVYPVMYANGTISPKYGEAIPTDRHHEESRIIVSSAQFFIMRQLWPQYCAVDEQSALELIRPATQLRLF